MPTLAGREGWRRRAPAEREAEALGGWLAERQPPAMGSQGRSPWNANAHPADAVAVAMMRLASWAAPVLLLLLAGCALPEDDGTNPLFGLCPQWEPAHGQVAGTVYLDAGAPQSRQLVGPDGSAYEKRGHPLDMVRLRIDEATVPRDGRVTLKAYAEANNETVQRNWRDLREDSVQARWVPALVFTAEDAAPGQEFEAYLTSVDHDEPPRAGPVRLEWTLAGSEPAEIGYTLTWHYKVCGIPA